MPAPLNEKIAYFAVNEERLDKFKHFSAPAAAVLAYLDKYHKLDTQKLAKKRRINEAILESILLDLQRDRLVRKVNPWILTKNGERLAREIKMDIILVQKTMKENEELRKILTTRPLISLEG